MYDVMAHNFTKEWIQDAQISEEKKKNQEMYDQVSKEIRKFCSLSIVGSNSTELYSSEYPSSRIFKEKKYSK